MNVISIILALFITEVVAEIGLKLQTFWTAGISLKNLILYSLLLFALLSASFARDYRNFTRLSKIHFTFLLFLFYGVISLFITNAMGNIWHYDLGSAISSYKGGMLDHYLFFFLFSYLVKSEKSAQQLIKFFVWVAILGSLATTINFYLPQLNFFGFDGESIRPNGFLGEPNQTAAVISLFIPVTVGVAIGAVGLERLFYWSGVAFQFMALIATSSRGGILGTALGLGVLIWLLRKDIKFSQYVVICLFALTFLVIAWVSMPEAYRSLIIDRWSFVGQTHINVSQASAGRTYIWSLGIKAWLRSPLFGHGWRSFNLLVGHSSHNSFLEVLVNFGVIGLAIYLALLRGIFVQLKKTISLATPSSGVLFCGILAGFLGVLVSVFFVNLYRPWFFIWAFLGISVCYSGMVIDNNEKKDLTL